MGSAILLAPTFKVLSALPPFGGFIMAGFTEKKLALHDKLAGSLVRAVRSKAA